MFEKERQEGYTRVVVRLEHYTKLRPDAECGRHVAHDPDPNFDPMEFMWSHRDAMSLADFPQEELHRFEAKLSVNFPMIEQRDYDQRKPFDLNDLKRNSLWYYPNGHAFDYGVDTPRPQKGLKAFSPAAPYGGRGDAGDAEGISARLADQAGRVRQGARLPEGPALC